MGKKTNFGLAVIGTSMCMAAAIFVAFPNLLVLGNTQLAARDYDAFGVPATHEQMVSDLRAVGVTKTIEMNDETNGLIHTWISSYPDILKLASSSSASYVGVPKTQIGIVVGINGQEIIWVKK